MTLINNDRVNSLEAEIAALHIILATVIQEYAQQDVVIPRSALISGENLALRLSSNELDDTIKIEVVEQ